MFIRDQLITPSTRPRYARAVFAAVLLLLVSSAAALAQGVGTGRDLSNASGNHVITGRIYFPTQPAGDIHVKVRLESTSEPSRSTATNADGVFRFSGLNTGYYTVVVDAGDQYEVFREQVAIERGSTYSPRSVQIPIYLRPKGSGPGTSPGVTSAALAGVPKPAVESYEKGLASVQKGDGKEAIKHLEKAVEIHPQFALALNELGVQYLKLGQPDKAAESLQAAVKIMPEEFSPRLNYGIALLNQKKFPEAEEQLREALKKNDKAPTAHMYLGIVLMSRNSLDEAEKELLLAVNSKSREVDMAHRYLGGVYWGKREYKKAADELETYLKLVPKAPDAERTRKAIEELRSKQ
jgi:Flp pilus assembly protein TadD